MPTGIDSLSGLRVLIVEDEALIVEELRDRLSGVGMQVVGMCSTAADALTIAVRASPDLVLMDIRLEGSADGIDAAVAIREQVDVPIVFLTAHSDRVTLERAKRTWPFGYVLKPFRENDLLVAMELAHQRHALERALRDSESRYVATLASIGDGVVAVDPDQRVTFMNSVAEALTGYVTTTANGMPADQIFRMFRDVSAVQPAHPLQDALRSHQAVRLEGFLVARDTEMIPIDSCASAVVDGHGAQVGAVVAFRDIRDRRLADDALRRAQEEVFFARTMEATGRLAAGIAHHFNNLLQVINGCTELALSNQALDGQTRELLTDVTRAGSRAAVLTRQFLEFAGRRTERSEVVDLNVLVTTSCALLTRLLGEHVVVQTHLSPSALPIFIEPTDVEQVIVNLALNGRDAMPDGGRLTITAAAAEFAGHADDLEHALGTYATLSVSDTGVGITEEVRQHLFEPFFTTKPAGHGTGMGLASAYGIVNQAGGFILVDSAPGHGSTFTVWLPLATSAQRRSMAGDDGTETILLVDDESAVRALLVAMLRRKGYTVLDSGDGQAALTLATARPGPIHLLVTTIDMPGMRGPELARRLHALDHRVPVLYISGGTAEMPAVAPGTNLLSKPFVVSALLAKIRQLLDS